MRIQEDHVQILKRDDGSTKNSRCIDKANIHNNRLQVINQYEIGKGQGGATRSNRYDVTVLVNGLPLVHVELKRRGVDIREAFNQIDRYQRDSFWAGSGLFEYVQLFVISNGTLTKYYSNTTRRQHLERGSRREARARKTSNSFEFTSWWADAHQQADPGPDRLHQDLLRQAHAAQHPDPLLRPRRRPHAARHAAVPDRRDRADPAAHRDLDQLQAARHRRGRRLRLAHHRLGQDADELSSPRSSPRKLPSVDKVLFVVDRKDLDYQTMREYDRFEKGAANSNTSTAVLKKQLEDPNARIIITTIQKLVELHRARTRATRSTTGTS